MAEAEPETTQRINVAISGFWNSVHRLSTAGTPLGVLCVTRGRLGLVERGRYVPVKGEVLALRRDPGLLRSQFSLWTERQEWLGSSLRWHWLRREIVLHTGSKPLRIQPRPGLRFGWSLVAPRTGEMARVHAYPLGRRAGIEVYRRVDPELVVFTYFLASQILLESLWPGPADPEARQVAAAKAADTRGR
jgi:hypothetical protein